MTSISGPRSAPSTAATQRTQTTSAPTTQQRSAATGYGSNDTFQPAPSSVAPAISAATEQLNKFPAGADRDAVAATLNNAWPTADELKAANDALNRLAEKAPEGMTQADFEKLSNGLGYKANMNTMMSMVTSNMQKQIEEIKKRVNKD